MMRILCLLKRKTHLVGADSKHGDYGRVSTRNIRVERMTSSVYLPFMDDMPEEERDYADPRNLYAARRVRRSDRHHAAVGSHDTGRIRTVSREGIRGVTACVLLTFLACSLGVAYLVDRSHVIEAAKEVSRMETAYEELSRKNADLERQLADRASEVNVGYEAAQMGMISARGVDVIYLSAPADANLTLSNTSSALVGERLATILGD